LSGWGRPRFEFLDLVKRNQDFVQIARSSRLIQKKVEVEAHSRGPKPRRVGTGLLVARAHRLCVVDVFNGEGVTSFELSSAS
jgi:hypothetical protein